MSHSWIRTVESVTERIEKIHLHGAGKNAKYSEVQTGWIITLDDHMTITTMRAPEFQPGDKVRLTIEAIDA